MAETDSRSTAVVFMADGMEMCECLLTVDILRRAGVNVITASIMDDLTVTSSHNVRIQADTLADSVDYDAADMIILPGGRTGTENLAACPIVIELCAAFASDGGVNGTRRRYVAAVCAAPSVLAQCGLLDGKNATCHPDFENKVRQLSTANLTGESVAVDDNIITGQGLGATMDFALCLAEILAGREAASQIAAAICYRCIY